MTSQQAGMAMLTMLLLTVAGMGCLFLWWFISNRGNVEDAKHDMLRGELGPGLGPEHDEEVYT